MLDDWIPTKRRPEPDVASASPALLRRRAIAAGLDVLLCYAVVESAVLAVLMVAFTDEFVAAGGTAIALSVVGLIPVYLLYSLWFEWRYGWTPGKKRLGVLVVAGDGSRPSVRAAALRNAARYVDFLPVGYVLGWLVARRSDRGRRLGDRLAGTLVVRPETSAPSLFPDDETRADETGTCETGTDEPRTNERVDSGRDVDDGHGIERAQ